MYPRTVPLALLAVALWGCAPVPPTAPTPTPVPLSKATSKDGKIQVSLPPDWVAVDPQTPQFSAAQLQGSTVCFLAVSKKRLDDFSDNCNIIRKTGMKPLDFTPENAQAIKASLSKSLTLEGSMDARVIQLPLGKAFRFQAETLVKSPAGPPKRTLALIYMTFLKQDFYQVTFSSRAKNRELFPPLADQMMQTLELKP